MKILKKVLGVICTLEALGGLIAAAQVGEPGLVSITVVFGLLAWLCFRRPKSKWLPNQRAHGPAAQVTTEYIPEVPKERLKEMRRYYTAMQAQNDARILAESFQLCQQTFEFDTFFSRLSLAQRSALTLLQAKQAKCKFVNAQTVKACGSTLAAADALKIDFLERKYEKETSAALRLKTPAGQRKRLEAFLDELLQYDLDFASVEEVYNNTIEKVKKLIQE